VQVTTLVENNQAIPAFASKDYDKFAENIST